jgi:light-regulated signal transduction histidine kinase (bacteriophytochrome)
MYADAPDVREEMSRCFTERTSIQRKILCQRGVAGEDKYLAVKYTFVLPDLVLVHTEDVTERVLAEESLKERTAQIEAVNEELNDFAYVVSHDLKAPLRAVTQVAGWIAQDYSDALGDEGQEMVQLLTGRTKRMHDLIQAILQYSRVGRLREEEKPVDLNQLVQETVEMLAPPEHIRVTVEDELPTVVGEPTRLGQVFQNLVDNAIRFVDKPEGWIRIGCVKQREHWQFSVADNGPGIEEKYHTKIFQPFQTLSRRDDVESTGIGLALVKRAVASWGGDVWVASSVGLGSTFYFTVLWIALVSVVLSCLVSKESTLKRISRASSCPA